MTLPARARRNVKRSLFLLGVAFLLAISAGPAVAETTAADTSTTVSTEAAEQTTTTAAAPSTSLEQTPVAQPGLVPPSAGQAPLNPGWKTDQMDVRVMPEFDERAVLVILRFTVPAEVELPTTVQLPIPAGAWIVGIGEIDADGQFNYNYTDSYPAVEEGAVWDIASIDIKEFRRLQVDYYYDPGLPAGAGDRSFPLLFQLPMDADALVVHVQQPARAAGFLVQPAPQGMGAAGDGFTYAVTAYTDALAGSTMGHMISYNNPDGSLSVDAVGSGSSGSGSSRVSTSTVLLAAILVVVVCVGGFILWRMSASPSKGGRKKGGQGAGQRPAAASSPKAGKKQQPAGKGSRGQRSRAAAAGVGATTAPTAEDEDGAEDYCVACGEELTSKSRFCPNCGEARP